MNIGVSTVQSEFRDIKFIPKVSLNQEFTVCGAEKAYVTHICLVLLLVPKFFAPDQNFIYILWQSQTFCARQEDAFSKIGFCAGTKVLKRH